MTKELTIIDSTEKRIQTLVNNKQLVLPKNYNAGNAIREAYLIVQELTDRNDKPALEVCTRESIANAFLKMATEGAYPSRSQGYFIVYKKQTCMAVELFR